MSIDIFFAILGLGFTVCMFFAFGLNDSDDDNGRWH